MRSWRVSAFQFLKLPNSKSGPGARLRGAGGLVLVALGLTVAMAAPVLRSPNSRLFGREIVGRHEAPFIVISQFESPRPLGLYTQPATDYLGAAVAAVTGSGFVAYNIVVLATFPLAALFTYLLAFQLTRSRPASWLAGLFYAFAPFHIAQSAYHPHGAQTQWLPLYLLALWLCLERSSARRLLLLGSSLALVAGSNFYYGLMAACLTPVAVLGFWLVQRRRPGEFPNGVRTTLAALGGLAAAGISYVAVFAPSVLDRSGRPSFPRADLDLYGAHWWSYFLPPVGHPLAATRVDSFWRLQGQGGMLEQQITLGFGLVLLALIAIVLYLLGERKNELRSTPALVLIAGAAFLVSLAPAQGLGEGVVAALLRPATMIYEILPMFRAYARFGLVVFLAVAILASASAVRLLRTGSKPGRALGIGLLALAAVELAPFPPFRSREILPTSAHRFLAGEAGPTQVLDCVSRNRVAEWPRFYRFPHRIALPGAYADCGDPDFATKLAHEGFTHFLVRKESAFGRWLEGRPAPASTRPVGRFEDALLFALEVSRTPHAYLEFERGFHWREFLGDKSYRWMGDTGTLTITNPSPEPVELNLQLELHAFPQPRAVSIEIDGEVLTRLHVSTEPGTYELPDTLLSPGRHTLGLLPETNSTIADRVLGNGDGRALSLALWGWSSQK